MRDPILPFACFSWHSPTAAKGTKKTDYIAESTAMVRTVVAAVSDHLPIVIGGDFNFTSFGRREEGEVVANTTKELAALEHFSTLGFSIAWRAVHLHGPLPQTLRWSKNPVTPYHCDGFMVRNLAIKGCEVLSTAGLGFPSDHDPVLMELAPKGAA